MNVGSTVLWLNLPGAMIYGCFALRLSIIDFRTRLLPDRLTLSLLWLGLLLHCIATPDEVRNAVYGAAAGYLSFWAVFQVFRWLTGKDGLGYGDFKLLAAIGAWNGWQSLPVVVVMASLLGLGFIGVRVFVQRKRTNNIAFGPWLAAAGWGEFVWQGIV